MKHKTKTTPKGSTYEFKSSMSPLGVIWVCKALFFVLAMCQLKLPQQVALTEFKGQVSAKVKVILMTESGFVWVSHLHGWVHIRCTSQLQLPQQVALTAFKRHVSTRVRVIIVTLDTRWIYWTKTTPKRCTYEFKHHHCLHLRWSEFVFSHQTYLD